MGDILSYGFVHNAIAAGALASLLCGLVGTFVVVKRLVFVSGGVSHAAFGGLGLFYFLGLPPLAGAAATALVAALALSGRSRASGRSQDAVIGILWAVGMAVGVVFIARTPGYAPNLTTYLFGDILAVSAPLVVALAVLGGVVLLLVAVFFKELLAVSFDEEFARSRGLATRPFVVLLMALIALSVVLLIQVVGAMLAIALLTIPPVISLSLAHSFRRVMLLAIAIGGVMTLGGLAVSFAYDLPSGPAIVLLGFAMLLAVSLARRGRSRRRPVTRALAALALLGGTANAGTEATAGRDGAGGESAAITPYLHLAFLGEARIAREGAGEAPLGGLSGLTYDAANGVYYAISDDRAEWGPARFYTLAIDLTSGRLTDDGIVVRGVTELRTRSGHPFGRGGVDLEAIALTPAGTLVIASEGDARSELAPFLREFSAAGRELAAFPLGERYRPRPDGQAGVRYNLAFESAALTPDGRFLFTATESALAQDGPPADLRQASPARLLRFDARRRRLTAEYLYWVEPVAEVPRPPDAFSTTGVVDLVALDAERLLVLERSFSVGRGNDVRLYEADLSPATDILDIESLARSGTADVIPASKRLLLHVDRLGIESDNLEGVALGPPLPDGRRTLLLLADDNFDREAQSNQLLAFALGERAPAISDLQGRDHRSPLAGDWVRAVDGIVTAIDAPESAGGFWMQTSDAASDGDERTSDGLRVAFDGPRVAVGDRVRVAGAVVERGAPGELTVTTLDAASVTVIGAAQPLPAAVRLGAGGRRPPGAVIDDDALSSFDPCCDALDFFESLEGMRVEVDRPVVVGATSAYGEIVVLADGGEGSAARSARGGVVLRPGDPNPQRVVLDDRLARNATPDLDVGQSFLAPVRGVVDYAFANFRLQVESWPPAATAVAAAPRPRPDAEGELSLASYNVLNLDPSDGAAKYRSLAASIVDDLHSPALLGLQEVQDDNGPEDDGLVSAERTLGLLLEAILAAGGPRYAVRQIDPGHNADGGEPNGNIRVAWLLDPARVRPLDRDLPDAAGDTSPMRVAADRPAFAGDAGRGWSGARRCLALDAVAAAERLLLVNCHLTSKRGDDRLFGARQPPAAASEEQRTEQVRELRAFVERRLAADPGLGVVVLGDMNELPFAPAMRLLASPPLVGLMERVPWPERYSFNFEGNSQLLDHVLLSADLATRVTDVAIAHVNADRAAAGRASDHDPVLVRLRRRDP